MGGGSSSEARNMAAQHGFVDAFAFTLDLTKLPLLNQPSPSVSISLSPSASYHFHLDWGDNTTSLITSHESMALLHTYPPVTDGQSIWKVNITGQCTAWPRQPSLCHVDTGGPLVSVESLGVTGWQDFTEAFRACRWLGNVKGGKTDLVTSFARMFEEAPLAKPDTSQWNTVWANDMR